MKYTLAIVLSGFSALSYMKQNRSTFDMDRMQEPAVSYCFKLFDNKNKEVKTSTLYQLKSLSLDHSRTIDDTLIFTTFNYYKNHAPTSCWRSHQYFRNIRSYLWIQIIEINKNDTMNVFLKYHENQSFYEDFNTNSLEPLPIDSIAFQKGNFVVLRQPMFADWKKTETNAFIKISGSMNSYLKQHFDQQGNYRK